MGRGRARRYPRALVVTAGVVAGVLALVGVGVGLKLRTNITVLDVNDALAATGQRTDVAPEGTVAAQASDLTDSDEAEAQVVVGGEPVTILVMGSDTREGQGDAFGSAAVIDGARSDTTMLVHLSGDREHATVVSIPRDLMVTLPECTMADGTPTYPYEDRFNAAFAIGGPECTIRTVTELTGLPVNHFVVVDFTAFERAIDALGGVEVCLTEAVNDPLSGLDLPAGVSRVDGEQGLAFVRARTSLGDGSDLARIERQQGFVASLVREATSRELLTDPLRLARSLDAATQSLTMDADLAWLPHSVAVARSLAGIDPADVSFVTYPNVYNDDFLTVREDSARADLLVAALSEDVRWPFPASASAASVAPQDVTVSVVNATGRPDQATLAATALAEQGFTVAELSIGTPQQATEVRYPASDVDGAETVAAAVGGSVVVRDDSRLTATLVLGEDWGVDSLRTVTVERPDEPSTSGDVEWVIPESELPTGQTSTADRATCAS